MADTDQATLAEAKRQFQRCRDAEQNNRETALDDIRFALMEEQWPEEVRQGREMARRPMLVINKLPSFIRQVVNDARQNKPSIEVHPVDSAGDPVTADIYAGIIRNIESVSNADVAYDTAAEQAVGNGFGYWRVTVDYAYDDAFDLDIRIDRIVNQFSVYGDPNSTAADSSDWDVAFVTDRIPKEDFKRIYGEKADTNWDSSDWKDVDWLNDDGVLIAEWWRRVEVEREIVMLDDGRVFSAEDIESNEDLQIALAAGEIREVKRRKIKSKKVTQTIVSGGGILEDEKEFECCYIPIVPVYGTEIIVEGKRYFRGLIHSAIDAQRMFNYWRTTATELVALAPKVPYIGPKDAFATDPGWSTVNTENHPYLEYDGNVPPQRQPLDTGAAAGALQEALNASDDMKAIIGMYDASLGARSNETSGKAIMARQREGDVSTFHFVDNVSRAIRHTGRILIDMIPRVYDGKRIVRVLGEDGTPDKVPVNQEYPATDENGEPMQEEVQDALGQRITQAVMAMHDLSVGKYDITVKSGPSFTTRREEAAYYMTEAVRSAPQTAPVLIPKIAEMSDWPGAQDIAKELQALMNPNAGGLPPDVTQMIEAGKAQIEQQAQEIEQLKAQLADKSAQTAIQAQKVENDARNNAEKNEIDRYSAETARMDTEIDVAGAQQRKAFGLPIN